MLRIGISENNESTSFTIEGKLTASGAGELEKCWQAVVAKDPRKPIVVNLAAVNFIDAASTELLTRMRRQGVRLRANGCFMNAIIEQIEADVD